MNTLNWPFKPQWQLYVPPTLTFKYLHFAHTHWIIGIKIDYSLEQHQPADRCNTDAVCLLRGYN
jgi:hypothetical protein